MREKYDAWENRGLEYLIVSESGLYTRADLDRMAQAEAHAFLVGESLMCEEDVEMATKKILSPPHL